MSAPAGSKCLPDIRSDSDVLANADEVVCRARATFLMIEAARESSDEFWYNNGRFPDLLGVLDNLLAATKVFVDSHQQLVDYINQKDRGA